MSVSVLVAHSSGDTSLSLELPSDSTAGDLLDHVRNDDTDLAVFVEDGESPLDPNASLSSEDGSQSYYVGPRVPIRVTVHYDGEGAIRDFSPATRLRTVERWAARELDAPTRRPHRLALRYADTVLTPDEDAFLGSLDRNGDRDLRFDLVVEGDRDIEITVIVNGRPKTVTKRVLTFAEVVALAFPNPPGPNTIYSVTYRGARGPKPSGTLSEGGSVKIKNKTTFNVTPTDKS